MISSRLRRSRRFILWGMLLPFLSDKIKVDDVDDYGRVTAPDDVNVDELKDVEVPGLAVDILDLKM